MTLVAVGAGFPLISLYGLGIDCIFCCLEENPMHPGFCVGLPHTISTLESY